MTARLGCVAVVFTDELYHPYWSILLSQTGVGQPVQFLHMQRLQNVVWEVQDNLNVELKD
jgi:hypothetical protein